jgi:hypothetical protein
VHDAAADRVIRPPWPGQAEGADKMIPFESLMRRADTMRRLETDPHLVEWWSGYKRGLRRAHHGEKFGTATEHELWMSAAESVDRLRSALGRGYRAGLTMEPRDPD